MGYCLGCAEKKRRQVSLDGLGRRNVFFLPENIAGAFRAKETTAAWSKRGHQVTVLTGYPNYPTGKLFPGYSLSFLSEDKSFSEEGIRVLRSKLSIKDNTSFLHRVWNALSFFFYGTWNVLFRLKKRMPKPQVVVASSGPIFAGLLGWIASLRFHCPLIFEIRDITFKQLLATGKSPRSLSYNSGGEWNPEGENTGYHQRSGCFRYRKKRYWGIYRQLFWDFGDFTESSSAFPLL